MDDKIAAFTIFTFFLFTVSAARLPVNPPATNPSPIRSEDASKLAKTLRESQTSAGSNILLPGERPKPDSDNSTAKNPLPEPEKTTNDSTRRTNFTRFHPINRHFRGKPPRGPKPIGSHRRPCRKSVTQNTIARTELDRNEDLPTRTDNWNRETFRGEVPTRRHHNQPRNNNDDVMKTKSVFDREKLKSLIRQYKQKKREEETGFMKNIRKFLKGTFD